MTIAEAMKSALRAADPISATLFVEYDTSGASS
jgi:hypothetical protein